MGIYRDLTGRGVSTRVAANLVGVPRATATPLRHLAIAQRQKLSSNQADLAAVSRHLRQARDAAGRVRDSALRAQLQARIARVPAPTKSPAPIRETEALENSQRREHARQQAEHLLARFREDVAEGRAMLAQQWEQKLRALFPDLNPQARRRIEDELRASAARLQRIAADADIRRLAGTSSLGASPSQGVKGNSRVTEPAVNSTCARCRKLFIQGSLIRRRGKRYCPECLKKYFCPKCKGPKRSTHPCCYACGSGKSQRWWRPAGYTQ